ncbi:condensation domain-containing protein, partial [Xanthomonas melonis]|uniref:condensation domain-containing protein n=1 Tax=Xanthomonas melonis TaxID=56456 RepID=UPI003EB69662
YASGDLCRRDIHGQLLFLGRSDRQVKLNGHRIELGEIEKALLVQEGVTNVVADVHRQPGGGDMAYACVAVSEQTDARVLLAALRQRLPAYMVPSQLLVTTRVPLTVSGKVDHAAILATLSGQASGQTRRMPETALQQAVATLWEEQFQRTQICLDDDFFSVGGHSIAAIRFIARFNALFNADVALVVLLDHPQLEAFCRQVDPQGALEQRARTQSLSTGLLLPATLTTPAHPDDEGPLSFAQSRLVFLQLLNPASSQYNMPYAYRIDTELDIHALRRALQWLVERHAVLRTGIHLVDGEPVQRIHPAGDVELGVHDLRQLVAEDAEGHLATTLQQRISLPFGLAQGRMLRTDVFQLPDQQTVLLLNLHHIASDGWSMGIVIGELSTAYAAFADQGRAPQLPSLPLRYLDVAAWERSRAHDAEDVHIAYWHQQLAGADEVAALPMDRPTTDAPTGEGGTLMLALPEALADALRGLSREERASRYAVALAGFAACLARWSGSRQVSVGTPTANREDAATHALVGFFVNMLVMRLDVNEANSFRQLVRLAKRVSREAQTHQGVPYEQLVERLAPGQRIRRSALFQIVFSYETAEEISQPIRFGRHTAVMRPLPHQGAKFDLTVNVVESGDTLLLVAEYAADVFEHARIEAICAQYRDTLETLLAAPDVPLAALFAPQPLPQALPLAHHRTADLFTRLQAHPPQAIALQGETVLDYATLLARVERLAVRLRLRGQGPGAAVGLLIEDRATLIVAILACLRSGAAFLVLDADYPPARLHYMLDNGRSACLLRQGAVPPLTAVQVLDLDAPDTDPAGAPGPVIEGAVSSILHTSGSTGEPKAVALPVAGLIQHALRMQQRWQLSPDDRVLQFNA